MDTRRPGSFLRPVDPTAISPQRAGLLFTALLLIFTIPSHARMPGFEEIHTLLQSHCGACHVQGVADGPWSLNTPPGPQRYATCLGREGLQAQLRCASYRQLVDEPGPGIPAWIRPADGGASEPYAEACQPEASFHIGHSIPAVLPDEDCARLLEWILGGAPE